MSEHIAAEIRIGGKVPASLVPELCQSIAHEGVALDWGDGGFSPTTKEELLEAREDCGGALLLRLYDTEAPWGEFEQLEHFLREHGISYDRLSDPKYEYMAQLAIFRRGTDVLELPTDPQHRPTVLADQLEPVANSLSLLIRHMEGGDVQKALQAATQAQELLQKSLPPTVPPLPAFDIVEEPSEDAR
ncbi:MAG: hypothetical protein ABSF26_17465 [Thermoguttaceae bacterium]|jgi:hypothetical protein